MIKTSDALEIAIERALAPYRRRVPPVVLEAMREEMKEYAATHPYPVALLRQLGPQAAVLESCTVARSSVPGGASLGCSRGKAEGGER